MSRKILRLSVCYAFFAPLVLMVELNMISKSAIHAFLARTDTPDVTLAGFNAAFTFYFAITSTSEVIVALSLSYLKSRADLRRIIRFTATVLCVPWSIALLAVFSPLGNEIFGGWFGLSAQGQHEARWATGMLALSAPVLLLRGTAFALLMLNRRTIVITWSTFVRLSSLGVSLLFLPLFLEGAAIGAAALVFCMASETVFAWYFAWKYLKALPPGQAAKGLFGSYWRFSWPLVINSSAEMGVIFAINLFLGRLQEAELAIAAFGIIHGLVSLLMAPMRNLAQTAQTLVSRREDVRVITVFMMQLIGGFVVFALILFQTPLRDTVLRGVMGLPPALAAYCEPAMGLAFTMAVFWACTALFRGLLSKARTTTALATAGILRIATAVIAGSISLVHPEVNGGVLGMIAWVMSYVVESCLSGWRLRRIGWFIGTEADRSSGPAS
jgi:O-antigen/teichoic acid export membrane protein